MQQSDDKKSEGCWGAIKKSLFGKKSSSINSSTNQSQKTDNKDVVNEIFQIIKENSRKSQFDSHAPYTSFSNSPLSTYRKNPLSHAYNSTEIDTYRSPMQPNYSIGQSSRVIYIIHRVLKTNKSF